MPSLGAIDPVAAAMFQAAFDKAVGAGKRGEMDDTRKMVLPKLGHRGVPFSHLRWAFAVACVIGRHLVDARAVVAFANEQAAEEPEPRDAITDYLKMMYVSGESGEPSVETTGIIEDIVRQQVIEIVSLRSVVGKWSFANLATSAQELHRTRCASRIAFHHHQRPHFPDPRRRSQGVSTAHLSLMERRAEKCQRFGRQGRRSRFRCRRGPRRGCSSRRAGR